MGLEIKSFKAYQPINVPQPDIPSSDFSILPNELFTHLLTFLGVPHLGKLSLTGRGLYHKIDQQESFWKELFFRLCPYYPSVPLKKISTWKSRCLFLDRWLNPSCELVNKEDFGEKMQLLQFLDSNHYLLFDLSSNCFLVRNFVEKRDVWRSASTGGLKKYKVSENNVFVAISRLRQIQSYDWRRNQEENICYASPLPPFMVRENPLTNVNPTAPSTHPQVLSTKKSEKGLEIIEVATQNRVMALPKDALYLFYKDELFYTIFNTEATGRLFKINLTTGERYLLGNIGEWMSHRPKEVKEEPKNYK